MSKKFQYDTDMLGYHVLTNEDLDAIHEATLDLMHDYGVQMHGKEALEILEGAGCEVDYEIDRVRFPKGLVNDAIESTPAEITLCGRDPKNDTVLGGKKVCYKNFGTGVFIFDPYTGELRESTKEIVYRYVNSVAMGIEHDTSPGWLYLIIAMDVLLALIAIACITLVVIPSIKKRKKI